MKESSLEVVILKPTQVFLSFLAAQVPDIDLPDLKTLQTDTTAYVIAKQPNEEATLEEIERLFPTMFRHEIARWLGDDAYNDIHASFLDFLCCFKFEMHSQMVLMERSVGEGQQLLCIKPRSVLLKWIKSSVEADDECNDVVERITLQHIVEDSTVLVKNFNSLADVKPFVNQYYKAIFKAEMYRMCDQTDIWPKVDSVEDFLRYFLVEIHTQLVHLN